MRLEILMSDNKASIYKQNMLPIQVDVSQFRYFQDIKGKKLITSHIRYYFKKIN